LGTHLVEVDQVRLVTPVDRVDRVVDRALDHRDPAGLAVSRRPEQNGLCLSDGIPIGHDIGARGGRRDKQEGNCNGKHAQ
jgi:hypothetical protein